MLIVRENPFNLITILTSHLFLREKKSSFIKFLVIICILLKLRIIHGEKIKIHYLNLISIKRMDIRKNTNKMNPFYMIYIF